MTELRLLFRFLDKDFLFRLMFVLLLYSIVPIADIILFLWLGQLIGQWLILAVAALVGLLGMLLAMREVRVTLERLRSLPSSSSRPPAVWSAPTMSAPRWRRRRPFSMR